MATRQKLEQIRNHNGVFVISWSQTFDRVHPASAITHHGHPIVAPDVKIRAGLYWTNATTRVLIHKERTTTINPTGSTTVRTTLTHYALPPVSYRWPAGPIVTQIGSPSITTREWLRNHWRGLQDVWEAIGRPEASERFSADEREYIIEQLDRLQGQIAEIRNAGRAEEEAAGGAEGTGVGSGVDCLDGSG